MAEGMGIPTPGKPGRGECRGALRTDEHRVAPVSRNNGANIGSTLLRHRRWGGRVVLKTRSTRSDSSTSMICSSAVAA
jgi:hypothetical protein